MVRTWYFHCRGMSSVPDWGTKIPQAAWCGKKKKNFLLYSQSCGTITSNSLPPNMPCCGYMSSFLVGINQEQGCLVITNLV